jgi:hypothetical protein
MIRLERAVVDDREAKSKRRVVGVDPVQLVRRGVGQRVEQDRADDAEHGGGSAEPEPDREDDGCGEPGRSREAPNAVPSVPPQVGQHRDVALLDGGGPEAVGCDSVLNHLVGRAPTRGPSGGARPRPPASPPVVVIQQNTVHWLLLAIPRPPALLDSAGIIG